LPVVEPGRDLVFLGGVAGGSAVLAAGGQLTGRATLRRNCRLAALASVSLGAVALVHELPFVFVSSARDPRYTIEPQKRRLAARRAAGITNDSTTTAG
jgi:hypothetical protein